MLTDRPPPTSPGNRFGALLQSYFRSGWAFLIPYLAAYLLYAWLRWPVNPASAGSMEQGAGSWVPCLLYVYWALHAIHLVFGAIALLSWWRSAHEEHGARSAGLVTGNRLLTTVYRLLPWLCLALLFYIPGVYLEWPSDTWEHFRRMTAWSIHTSLGDHPVGHKTFYFFAYTFLGHDGGSALRDRLELYTVSIGLLLAWQYFRLAKAVGLEDRWAFAFVLVNVVFFGNTGFSFYRYYGLASTMYAQLGAVALTRLFLEFVHCKAVRWRKKGEAKHDPDIRPWRARGAFLGGALLLLLLIAMNHIQGIGIAGIGSISIGTWWVLHEKGPRVGWWLAGSALGLSAATIFWWPRHSAVEQVFIPEGWLTDWYGFNFMWPSPAAERSMQILGVFGLVNLLLGLVLLRRNHVAGWLTVGPLIALMLPFIALPFANSLAGRSTGEIITFHRMLFAIPSGLALICCMREWTTLITSSSAWMDKQRGGHFAMVVITALLVTMSPSRPVHNRFWHFIYTLPQDLQLAESSSLMESVAARIRGTDPTALVASEAVGFAFNTFQPTFFQLRERSINQSMTPVISHNIDRIRSSSPLVGNERLPLNQDPFAADPAAWTSISGPAPEFIIHLTRFPVSSTALQNPAGQPCQVFTSALIPIEPARNYGVELSLRQSTGFQATAYLAIAWYNAAGDLLASNLAQPAGAGAPRGWVNGSFSYFGLVADTVPTDWTTYRKSFGPDKETVIPSNARSVRIGALLNYYATPHAVVQMTNARLWEKSSFDPFSDGTFPNSAQSFVIILPHGFTFTPGSQAGWLMLHWPAHQLASQFGGGPEIRAAALSARASPTNPRESILKLGESPVRKDP